MNWKEIDKEWVIRLDEMDQERGQMKKLRQIWWHVSDDLGLIGITIALILAGALLWLTLDHLLGLFR